MNLKFVQTSSFKDQTHEFPIIAERLRKSMSLSIAIAGMNNDEAVGMELFTISVMPVIDDLPAPAAAPAMHDIHIIDHLVLTSGIRSGNLKDYCFLESDFLSIIKYRISSVLEFIFRT
ncbi:hypothetical protein LXL04_034138 [Taraxacum kok-saghyz]